MKANLTFTDDYGALAGCDLVVEAATENLELKQKIFAQLARVCGEGTILASNSSHLEPERIFDGTPHPGRCLVLHYFFPAERNRALEIVPSDVTDGEVVDWLLGFYEEIGKAPIRVKSRYGYAIDPIFEGIFLASALAVEEGLGTTKEVDSVARRALGLAVGPFTAMNLTGGNPITLQGLGNYTEKIHAWFRPPQGLKDQVHTGEPWDVPGRGEEVPVEPEREATLGRLLQGAYLGLVTEILDSGIATLADLEMGVEMALEIRAPFRMMNDLGIEASLALVEEYAASHEGFPVPNALRAQAETGLPWEIPYIVREDREDVAVVTIRRPRVLNALNGDVFDQIQHTVEAIEEDPAVRAAVITGYGTKAFVSGADVGFLAGIGSPEEAERTSQASQAVLETIARAGKPVVCALNGLAFGGGAELAMACTARVARKGLPVLAGQPEVNLGIIPGAGGSQRLPRLIGVEPAAEMMRTARTISSEDALLLGLIVQEVEGDLVAEAVSLARGLAEGSMQVSPMPADPIDAPASLPDVDIGHRSRAIDAILCRAILEGAGMTLEEGLRHESAMFGECFRTEDARIGIESFLRNGPRSKAPFVHR